MKYVHAADEIFTTRPESSDHFHTPHEIIESALKYSQRVVNIRAGAEIFTTRSERFHTAYETFMRRMNCVRAACEIFTTRCEPYETDRIA